MDPVLDRSSSKQQSVSKSAKLIQNFLKSENIIDIWRYLNPTQKKKSFFSQPHNSYSRIDYFFLDSKLFSAVKYIDYEAIVLSDHAPLKLQLVFKFYLSHTRLYRDCITSSEMRVGSAPWTVQILKNTTREVYIK